MQPGSVVVEREMWSSVSSTQGGVVVLAATVIALFGCGLGTCLGVGVATLTAFWEGHEGILVGGGC